MVIDYKKLTITAFVVWILIFVLEDFLNDTIGYAYLISGIGFWIFWIKNILGYIGFFIATQLMLKKDKTIVERILFYAFVFIVFMTTIGLLMHGVNPHRGGW